ncbi:hypothetical protein Q8F55_006133 [Vanrija albida]|uniref:Xylanolytic transcriptional activator regulatory domain-containing protein n=1 Tax=Vanrija albida TaxID=181172 RepID=A0ABR3PWC6_9TREE
MCERRGIDCVFDRNVAELVVELEAKQARIAVLEAIVRKHVRDLGNVASLDMASLSEALERIPVASAEIDLGSQPLPPSLVAIVENKLKELNTGNRRHHSVINYMSSQLGVNEPEVDDTVSAPPAAWPPYEFAVEVVQVFVQTNSMWPIFTRAELMADVESVYHGAGETPGPTCRLFFVFSIACVWLAQRGSGDRIDTSLLRNRALSCLLQVLRTEDSVTCVGALALFCLSAIYDWGGPDHPQLTPAVAQVTLAIGLQHEPPAHLSEQEKERRRLLFWGVYCMDRAVAGNLGKNVNFNRDDVTVLFPSRLDPLGSLGEGFEPLEFFKHIRDMWELNWEVNYGPTKDVADLHRRLDEWHARIPAGPPASLFHQYHKQLLAILYRPRCVTRPPEEHIRVLEESAAEAINVSIILQEEHKLFDNYYQFNSVIGMGVILICSYLLRQDRDPVWCAGAIAQLGRAQVFIGSFCRGWPYARGMSRAFDSLAARIVELLSGGLTTAAEADISKAAADLAIVNAPPLDLNLAGAEDHTMAWDEWISHSLVTIDSEGIGDANLDALMATIGETPTWVSAMVSGGPQA